ncbi:hypothetical protein [Actinoplanes philippinensis]
MRVLPPEVARLLVAVGAPARLSLDDCLQGLAAGVDGRLEFPGAFPV